MKWRCPCGSGTQSLAEHSAQGLICFWETQAPPCTPNRRVAASLGQGDRGQWEETGAQLPEERRDDRVMGKVTLPRAGMNPLRECEGGGHQLSMAVRFGAEAQW